MGIFSFNILRSRSQRQTKLPLYEKISRDQSSNDSESSDDSDSDDESDYSDDSSPSGESRRTSSSLSSSAGMLPKRAYATPQRPRRTYLYRLPNKIIRCLCISLITTIMVIIVFLVRASVVENRKIRNGDAPKLQEPPPPWESFEFLTRYYGGVRTLVPFKDNVPQYPRLEDEQPFNATDDEEPTKASPLPTDHKFNNDSLPPTKAFATEYPGSVFANTEGQTRECFLDEKETIRVPLIRYFDGRPDGFPQNVMGSYDLLSLPEDICFDRYGRYGPYGYGYSIHNGGLGAGEHGEMEGTEAIWEKTHRVDYRKIDWAQVQRRCYHANENRFKPSVSKPSAPRGFYIQEKAKDSGLVKREDPLPETEDVEVVDTDETQTVGDAEPMVKSTHDPTKPPGDLPRTAIVVRCWDEYLFREEDLMNLRALITEASLASGSRYDVHLLVQVKNDARHPIWADEEVYRKRIEDAIPREFRGLVTLWTETQMLSLYQGIHDLYTRGPDLPVHGSYRGLQMAMQYFAYNHPEYDYYWQWEMDIRYTGHYYDLFEKMEKWAQEQPRKGLWERNARFYLPAEHGSWEDFKQMARVQTEMGTPGPENMWSSLRGSKSPQDMNKGEQAIWGPKRPLDEGDWFETESDPEPPTTYDHDKYTWGVGEEADLITLNPMFDPEGTTWLLADDITGYNESEGIGKPPRRAQIITASRMSRKLLMTMHRETAFKKHHAFPEMWAATVALQHGFKAVYVPHPLYVDREWPTQYMARVFNGGKNGASGGSRTSVFGQREHNFRGLTWFYNSGFAPNLYKRWIGLKINNDGGEQFETTADMTKNDTSVPQMRGGEGRMCLPPMLLHPIKDVDLPVEHDPAESDDIQESDPSM